VNQIVQQRLSGTPLQHIIGTAPFRHSEVRVGPGVFIPRPETELLAGWAIDHIKEDDKVVELCAGSGALSLAIHQEASQCQQWAVEKSEDACVYLSDNLQGTPVEWVCSDMEFALPELNGGVDVLVVNPPYLPLPPKPDGGDFPYDVLVDPWEALFAGDQGEDLFPVVARVARRLLKPGGVLGCEHGDDQSQIVSAIFSDHGFVHLSSHCDLNNRPRFITAMKPNMQ